MQKPKLSPSRFLSIQTQQQILPNKQSVDLLHNWEVNGIREVFVIYCET